MQGLGGLLCLATVAIEALLSVMAAALSGFGLFFRVSFRWGHDDLLRIVMSSIPTYMKETMSHLASISKRQTRGEDAPAPPSYKPFMMNGFHGVSSENPHQCLLKVMFGKARIVTRHVSPIVCSVRDDHTTLGCHEDSPCAWRLWRDRGDHRTTANSVQRVVKRG